MVNKFIWLQEKHKPVNKHGFTLLETLIVLVVVVLIYALIPKKLPNQVVLQYEVANLKELLLQAKMHAIYDKVQVEISIHQDHVRYDEHEYTLHAVDCGQHEIVFNERGNVNQARTITCMLDDTYKEIIIYLGSGLIYVR